MEVIDLGNAQVYTGTKRNGFRVHFQEAFSRVLIVGDSIFLVKTRWREAIWLIGLLLIASNLFLGFGVLGGIVAFIQAWKTENLKNQDIQTLRKNGNVWSLLEAELVPPKRHHWAFQSPAEIRSREGVLNLRISQRTFDKLQAAAPVKKLGSDPPICPRRKS